MRLTARQLETKSKVETVARMFDIDPKWAVAVALTESSLGDQQVSPTGCKGVFQMSRVAMEDLRLAMADKDDDLVDIVCGVAFLKLLLKRHGCIAKATMKFCDPKDREFYLKKVLGYMTEL